MLAPVQVQVQTIPEDSVPAKYAQTQAPVPRTLTRLGKLKGTLAPLSQAHDGHHLGAQAAASLLGCGGPGSAPSLLGSDLAADAGTPHHVPGSPSRGRTWLPVEHGPRGGRASGNPEGWEGDKRIPHQTDNSAAAPGQMTLGESLSFSEVEKMQGIQFSQG